MWRLLEAEVNGRSYVGQVGVRDPEHPCAGYTPTAEPDLLGIRITAAGNGRCDSDGHYLCGGCAEISAAAIARLEGQKG